MNDFLFNDGVGKALVIVLSIPILLACWVIHAISGGY